MVCVHQGCAHQTGPTTITGNACMGSSVCLQLVGGTSLMKPWAHQHLWYSYDTIWGSFHTSLAIVLPSPSFPAFAHLGIAVLAACLASSVSQLHIYILHSFLS